MNQKKRFKPQNLRAILSVVFILLVVAGCAGFYFGINIVRDYAVEVNHRLADADASGKQVQELQQLKEQLSQSNSLIQKADQLFATPASYQAQVLTDLKRYADSAGLAIAATTFSDPATTGIHSVTITLRQPVGYSNLITFLNAVEGSLPKLQVSSLSLGQPASGGASRIKTGEIKIDISVR